MHLVLQFSVALLHELIQCLNLAGLPIVHVLWEMLKNRRLGLGIANVWQPLGHMLIGLYFIRYFEMVRRGKCLLLGK